MWREGVGDMLVKKNRCTRIKGWRHALIHPERSSCHCCYFPLSYIVCPYLVEHLTHEDKVHVTSEGLVICAVLLGRMGRRPGQMVENADQLLIQVDNNRHTFVWSR